MYVHYHALAQDRARWYSLLRHRSGDLELVTAMPELKSTIEERTSLHRVANPEEFAAAVLCLASSAGAFLTGNILEADFGTHSPSLDSSLPDL